jgi:hypothetical protein
MIWNHDQDEPLMTRRKFFFLAGMTGAFAVAKSTGLIALAERASPLADWHTAPPWKHIYGRFDIDSVLKEIYAPMITEQLKKNNNLLMRLGDHNAITFTTRKHRVSLATVPNTD